MSGPYPYFNTEHVCHDYEGLLGWDRSRSVDETVLGDYDWAPPKDAVKLKKAP